MGTNTSTPAQPNEPAAPGAASTWDEQYVIPKQAHDSRVISRGIVSIACTSRIDHRTYFVQYRPRRTRSRVFGNGAEDSLAQVQMTSKRDAYRRIVQEWGPHPSVVAGIPSRPHAWFGDHDVHGSHESHGWIVNEHVPGHIRDAMRCGCQTQACACTAHVAHAYLIFDRLAHCASRLHSIGILHMDICPDNIRLRHPGDLASAVLVDLGVCQPRTDHADLLPGDELPETRIGHTSYMSLAQHIIDVPHVADDIESIVYVSLWVARKGCLPWEENWQDHKVAAAKENWIRQAMTTTPVGAAEALEKKLAQAACRCWQHGRISHANDPRLYQLE